MHPRHATVLVGTALIVILAATACTAGTTADLGAVTFWLGSGTSGAADGTTTTARFTNPGWQCAGHGTDLYLPGGGDSTLRKVDTSTGVVTVVAGALNTPGTVTTTVAGTNARLTTPVSVIRSKDSQYLYIVETNLHCINQFRLDLSQYSGYAGVCGFPGASANTKLNAYFLSSPPSLTNHPPELTRRRKADLVCSFSGACRCGLIRIRLETWRVCGFLSEKSPRLLHVGSTRIPSSLTDDHGTS
jgi:hypothetical protein